MSILTEHPFIGDIKLYEVSTDPTLNPYDIDKGNWLVWPESEGATARDHYFIKLSDGDNSDVQRILLKNTQDFVGVPGVSEDFNEGYSIFSEIHTTTNDIYKCTGDGAWKLIT